MCFISEQKKKEMTRVKKVNKIYNLHSPSHCLTLGASLRAGSGTEMMTLVRSNMDEASYSRLTYVSFPETEGQQLTAPDKKFA